MDSFYLLYNAGLWGDFDQNFLELSDIEDIPGHLKAIKINPALQRKVTIIHHKEKHIGATAAIFKNLLNSYIEIYSHIERLLNNLYK